MIRLVPRDLPWQPLGAIAAQRGWSDAAFGLWCGKPTVVSARRAVQRWKADGLTVWDADLVATALGTHPLAIWGVAWTEARDGTDPSVEAFVRLLRWSQRNGTESLRRGRWAEHCRELNQERRPHRCALDGCSCWRWRGVLEEAAA